MTGDLLYLDSSALVKLVLQEDETQALLDVLEKWPERVSSVLAAIEVSRATRRGSQSEMIRRRADQIIEGIHLLELDSQVLDRASSLEPVTLRSLDAIHLASALTLQPHLGALIAYDRRLVEAAKQADLTVLVPR